MPPDTPQAPRPILQGDVIRLARRFQVPVEMIEKDILLSYLLVGIAGEPGLSTLGFKGGTALKKMYFGAYRFSEDLDFSSVDQPSSMSIESEIRAAVAEAERRLLDYGHFRLRVDRLPEQRSHPMGQDAFRVLAAFPWHRSPMVRVKIEITHDEPVLLPAERRTLIHGYDEMGVDLGDVRLRTYRIEEIVAEKLRALRQTESRLIDRGWSRPRARDYYDLWRIVTEPTFDLDRKALLGILPRKMAARTVTWHTVDDFFTPTLLAEAQANWESSLGHFVPILPPFASVVTALHPLISDLLA